MYKDQNCTQWKYEEVAIDLSSLITELGTELSVIPWKLESDDADEYKLSDVYDRLSESDKLGRASVNIMSGVCIRNINSLKQQKRHR